MTPQTAQPEIFVPALVKTPPWRHQVAAYNFAYRRPGCLLAMDMGTGKSKVVVDLAVNTDARRVLIICPKSVLTVWPREFKRHAAVECRCHILQKGTSTKKAAELRKELARDPDETLVVIVNYDSVWRGELGKTIMQHKWDIVVCDESHRIKAPGGKASLFLARLRRLARRRLCLTGTPAPHSPLDLYAQFRFIDHRVFGWKYAAFRDRYAKTHPEYKSQVLAWRNQKEMKERFNSIAYRCRAGDVLDLPDAIHEKREVELDRNSAKLYHEIDTQLRAAIESGEVTAANALVRLLRLQQVTGGHVTDDDGDVRAVGAEKQEALTELLDGIDAKDPVVVFCRFRAELTRLSEIAGELGRQYGEVSGSRKDLVDGCMPAGVTLLGVQIAAGGVGIDLTRARYAVYYSLGFSLGDYEQSLARLRRPGQERTVFYYHLIARCTVDEKVYEALRARKKIVDSIVEGYQK